MSQDLMFLRLFNEFAATNPQAADEWLFAEEEAVLRGISKKSGWYSSRKTMPIAG